uniref:Proteasome subunit beta n=1 Tax=Acrobeloides nanus TaxID=290746 RepID=A0A914DS25_9BILA
MQMKKFKELMHNVSVNPLWMNKQKQAAQRWNPYSFEGGSTVAISGPNFVVIATDTRMSQSEMNILTRDADKIHILNKNIVIATSGFQGDVLQLKRVLDSRLHQYRFDYRRDMTVDVCAELLARNLYYRRFFPYYTGAILAGIDEHGKGAVFGYDPIGCIERQPYDSTGAGEPIITPFLDNQVGYKNLSESADKPPLTLDRAIKLVRDAFRMVAEREITTGDRINLVIAEAGQPVKKISVNLRED